MAVIYIALGTNIGDGNINIDTAIELLSENLSEIIVAKRYRTKPMGYIDQPDFLNTALCAETMLSPEELLAFTQDAEQRVGRIRRFRWGPREIDIDLIFYGEMVLQTPRLTIPHPEFTKRDFVLKPLCDIAPNFVDPISGKSLQALLDQLPTSEYSIIEDISDSPLD